MSPSEREDIERKTKAIYNVVTVAFLLGVGILVAVLIHLGA